MAPKGLWSRYGDETVRQCVPKSSAADRRKSEGWYNDTVDAIGAE